ncbi:hypothetical protein TrVE_jg4647 [Triparma verrucosa]|uniref:BTB domain-containing protein n=2 Tax=Triparma TaxID=722752 RepID=A0A9W7C7I3_9STRA|nr:hypothetical protein TrST_g9326 [Triparma strigata]GMI01916.1 hypothetical protein TrVE_jg4647 [Triparma verrucosa]|eukprot:CAMPEP_0182490378 /NCGR_PEP_ID=MMETSP1321-20130603/256_1 /TAXON_ID=91990 /ORGANISM="Bolidomonas sp., Strain RCC1657" /LENGTH=341 /DNA_ID=CAMNT_0024692545 /DNA_START=137 /DNA_END=1162 /DNA_ORIENTATION=-
MDAERQLIIDDVLGGIQQKLSLEGTVLEQRAAELKTEAYKLARQRAFLREERRKAREDALAIDTDQQEFTLMQREDWYPTEYLKGGERQYRKVKVNVGGQLFELSEIILNREPGSLLSALLEDDSPLANGEEGVVHVDRDWWTFRHILKFLRDGVLPRDKELLTLLYKEASFWRLRNLKLAIEEERLNLRRRTLKWDDKNGDFEEEEVKLDKWYKNLPNWWESSESRKKRQAIEKRYRKKKGKKGADFVDDLEERAPADEDEEDKDWWTGHEYKGREYNALSNDERRVVTDPEDEDAKPMLSSTWSTSGSRGGSGFRGVSSSHDSGLFGNYGDYCYPGVGI